MSVNRTPAPGPAHRFSDRGLVTAMAGIWLVLVIVGSIIIALLKFPPQPSSNVSKSIQDTIKLITWAAWPIFTLVITGVLATVLLSRRHADAPPGAPDRIRGNPRIAATWISIVSAIVLVLAVVGTLTLANEDVAESLGVSGRGTGGGANGGNAEHSTLEVQVIAQQWQFTYRYPSYGGMESPHLVLPTNTTVTLHVTSLDVVHSFWFPALGVKVDAVPVHDNTFAVTPQQVGSYRIVCSELCGLWHGSMSDNSAQLMTPGDFASWAQQQQSFDAPIMKYLPPYSHTYVPAPAAYGA